MKHIIIGTAGHIDHGKTALIRALTGRNTDRLKEEQQRGITIELGFTWFDLKDGTRCGIIDVPGHEKFVGNMVSGVVGMDLVLMVVAADEGIMPQTREHLDILQLLGVKKTILVLSKCDLVEEDWMEMVEAEIREKLAGTIMEQAPLVRVSSVTGEGIGELKDLIARMVREEVPEREAGSIPRLPVDRIFTISGFGTIVTGTLLSGTITKGDILELYPDGRECRIRGIQVHEEEQESARAGQRVAVNLANIRKEEVHRGCVIAPCGSMKSTDRVDVKVSMLAGTDRILKNRERLHLYTGTSEILCRAVLLDHKELRPGESGFAQLNLEKPLAVRRGDRFVIRFYSPVETIGGGVILEANPGKKKRFDEAAVDELRRKESGSLGDVCEFHIRTAGDSLLSRTELAKLTARTPEELIPWLKELEESGAILEIPLQRDSWYWHRDSFFAVQQEITRDLRRYHEEYPYRSGIRTAEIRSAHLKKTRQNVFDECIKRYIEQDIFHLKNHCLSLPDFAVRRDGTYGDIAGRLTGAFERAGFELLRLREVDTGPYPETMVRDVLQNLVLEGEVVLLEDEMYTLRRYIDEAQEKIERHFETHDVLTYTHVKEMLNTSRKCTRAVVGYMDRTGVTKKVGGETERVSCR